MEERKNVHRIAINFKEKSRKDTTVKRLKLYCVKHDMEYADFIEAALDRMEKEEV